MQLTIKKAQPARHKSSCLVVAMTEGKPLTPLLKELDKNLEGAISRVLKDKEFTGDKGQTLLLHCGKALSAQRLLLVGLGKPKKQKLETLRQAAGSALDLLREKKIHQFGLDLESFSFRGETSEKQSQTVCEGLLLAEYQFNNYLTDKRSTPPVEAEVTLLTTGAVQERAARKGAGQAEKIIAGVSLARNLVNEPGNIKSPEFLAATARTLAREHGLKCTILERPELEKNGFGALLGVAQGSSRDPRLIVLEYQGGGKDEQPIALVGKGVVFDAGGISLKPAEKMDEMKMDMAGGAAVLGTLKAAALLQLPVNLVGIVPAVENLPSGTAYRPGDILTSLSGQTIEVLNTDAEGRLILADALSYAERFKPRVVIDLATLTGACIIALGHHAAAVLGNHDGLARQLIKAGERSGERLWQLPLWEDYAAQIKSHVADMKNIGGRPAGTITAAAFLQKFADNYTWAHLDIAGTAWEDKGSPCVPKGGTGFGVRLLIDYLSHGH